MSPVALTVHRSTHDIGGNCIELASEDGHRLILDVGRPLDAPEDATELLPTTLDVGAPVDGVLISHAHQDHYGLLDQIPDTWPVHCGPAAERLMRITAGIFKRRLPQAFVPWQHEVRFDVGPFAVTPFLTDHSAFDAYMLLIEVQGRRILYSGDFRTHGRKGALTRRFMANPPPSIDLLLLEGTNLGTDKSCASEADLEDRFVDLFMSTPGRVFVAWSAQNIDRTITIYRACLKTGRTLVVDLYTAEVLEMLGEYGRLPRAGWKNLKVVITTAFAQMYRKTGRESFVDRMAQHGLPAKALARTPERWAPMIRPSLIRDYAHNGVVPTDQDAWSWSMWTGYLEKEDGRTLQKWFDDGRCPAAHIHTSGHAAPEDLRDFARAISAKRVVPIHGVAWDAEAEGFDGITRLADGQVWVV